MALEVGLNRLLSFPTFLIEQVSRISNYEVNAIPPDTLFAEGDQVVVDSVAVEEDTLLDREGVAVPLNKAEATAYETIDSTMTLAKAYEPKGPLAKVVNASARNDDSGDEVVLAGDGNARRRLDLDFEPHLRMNRVEGFYGELGIGRSFGKYVRLSAAVGISTALPEQDAFSFNVAGRVYLDKNRRLSLSANFADYTDTQSASTPALRTLNGAIVLFEGEDYFDYYRNTRFRTLIGLRIPDIDTRVSLGIQREDHALLEKKSDYDVLGGSYVQRNNPGIEEGNMNAVVFNLEIGDDEESLGITGQRYFTLGIEHSTPDFLDSDFSFTTYNASLEWRFTTFFQRRLLPNVLDLKVVAQISDGAVPLQRFGAIDGRMSIYNRFGTLKTLQDKPYRGEESLGLFWEHNFKTVPFELLGMRKVAESAINVIVFGGHARNWQRSEFSNELVNQATDWHHEAGLSISGLFSLFRVDFAARLDAPGFTVGLGTARIF